MAKKKEPKKDAVDLKEAIDEIKQRFGEGAFIKMSEVRQVDVDLIPTGSISVDLILGVGGVPRGSMMEICGYERSGQTTVACRSVV